MSKIDKPVKTLALNGGNIRFYNDYNEPYGDYRVCGGVSFPAIYPSETGAKVIGYIVTVAQDVKTGKLVVLDEMQFLCVDHMLDDKGLIIQDGVSSFVARAYAEYKCRKWYWHQDIELAKGWRIKLYRAVSPVPQFIRLLWGDDKSALGVVWQAFRTGQLKGIKGGQLQIDVQRLQAMPDMSVIPPSVWALSCAVNGLSKFPCRRSEDVQDV